MAVSACSRSLPNVVTTNSNEIQMGFGWKVALSGPLMVLRCTDSSAYLHTRIHQQIAQLSPSTPQQKL
jgi:hypothetical protein